MRKLDGWQNGDRSFRQRLKKKSDGGARRTF